MTLLIVAVFVFVYAGMVLGRVPGLALDRTGIALLGAIALVATGAVLPQTAWLAVDVTTIGLLLGLMVLSAQFRLGGFYAALARRISGAPLAPGVLLLLLIGASAALSAVLANDIVCLAITPPLIDGCRRRGLNPRPFLLGLACAANVGSAATLIGNPQNMLIGQTLNLSFPGYLLDGGVPAVLGCAVIWAVIWWQARGAWRVKSEESGGADRPFNPWQTTKGALVAVAVMVAFLCTDWPRDVVALTAAGVLLLSRRMHTRAMLALVDWHLLVLFCGLFVLNHALLDAGLLGEAVPALRACGIHVDHPVTLFVICAVLSNLVSNVPAVMLLLPVATFPFGGAVLALSSTLAGNLFIVGSIANIIVVEQAARQGVRITWREHARVGLPVTLSTLGLALGWLWLCGAL